MKHSIRLKLSIIIMSIVAGLVLFCCLFNALFLEKYYIVDIGMRYMLLGSRQADAGHVLENIVYLELLRRGYDVYVGKINSYEVDFVAQNKKGTVYFQVALTVQDENTLLRELRPLQAIRDHYPKIILTMDEEPEEQYEGIRRINARDWLLGIVD